MNDQSNIPPAPDGTAAFSLDPAKFRDPETTAKGELRASVPLTRLETLWVNTGTLCNIECAHCYIESSPTNDRLQYFRLADLENLLDEIGALGLATGEIGFTGGEPFMNPEAIPMIAAVLQRGLRALVLTNAMRPMLRRPIQEGLLDLREESQDRLTLRVSLDHFTAALHDRERGPGSFAIAMEGLKWLTDKGFKIDIAGRTCFGESEAGTREGFARLFAAEGIAVDAANPGQLVLFPEMDETVDVPEITTACWDILGKAPAEVMCATSRMAVHRKGEARPAIMPCTLLPYDTNFSMGSTLEESLGIDTPYFDKGAVRLNHPHCAKFCVLGGGSCTA